MKIPFVNAFPSMLLAAIVTCAPAAESDSRDREDLRNPRISILPPQRMLVVTLPGDPGKVGESAFRDLFRIYYRHVGNAEKRTLKAPRARRPLAWPDGSKGGWTGKYALPISEDFPSVNEGNAGIEVWDYGMVAEIIHIGPYSLEEATLDKLKGFVARQGFTVIGDHEEEYLQGPGTYFKGDPRNYRTLIRYRLEKAPQTEIAKSAPPSAAPEPGKSGSGELHP